MKPNEFISLIEGYWKEALTSDNRRIYRRAVGRFKSSDLRRISDAVVETCVFFPKVRDILAVAEGLSIEEPKEKTHGVNNSFYPEVYPASQGRVVEVDRQGGNRCPDCNGATWLPVTLKHPQTGRPYEAVTSCACTSRESAPAKAKQPKAKQLELMPIAKVSTDYPG